MKKATYNPDDWISVTQEEFLLSRPENERAKWMLMMNVMEERMPIEEWRLRIPKKGPNPSPPGFFTYKAPKYECGCDTCTGKNKHLYDKNISNIP